MYEILGGNIIFDRFHWSDYVYGALERNYDTTESSKNIEKIEEKLLKNNAIIVYIRPTDIEESSRQHGKNLDKYNKLMELCYYMCKLRKVKVISCDYNSIDKIVEDIKNGRI